MSLDEHTDLIEEGTASIQLATRVPSDAGVRPELFDVIVVGGGQAGLSVGYHLARADARFVILDAHERIGDAWRKRWDSLRLFTPAKFDGLDGMPFPAPRNYYPTKDEMANYLEAYARRFRLPVRTGVRVERLFRRGELYVVKAGDVELEARQVVVAMAKYQHAQVPDFAASLAAEITQLHALDYRNLRQLKPGRVLLVGQGNSGADIALETAAGGHETWLAGRDNGDIPFRPERFLGRNVLVPLLLGVVFHHVLTVDTALGRKARPAVLAKGGPRIRVKARDLDAAGVVRAPRVVGARDGLPLLEGGRTLEVDNVIWCTGFRPGFEWIELPIFDSHGEPNHRSGVVEGQPGLYFVGLLFLHAMSSSMVWGVGRDAARIVAAIEARLADGRAAGACRTQESASEPEDEAVHGGLP
jgi:putative flavoprotein involved in K+ transport